LKPENLLVDANDNIKITDFGLSNIVYNKHGENKMLMTACGTPNYVAPEVIKEKGYDGFSADVWSMGVILYVLLAGYLPFEDNRVENLFKKIESGKVKYPNHFSKSVKDLIQKMLRVNPKKRITVAGIKKHKWVSLGWVDDNTNMEKIMVSSVDISNAVQDSFYGIIDSVDDQLPSTLNAFEIASQFMMGSISTMATGQSIKRNTRFMVCCDAEKTKLRIMEAAKETQANPKEKGNYKIKCFTYFGDIIKSVITFSIVIMPTVSNKLTVVEFIRGRGSILDFQQYYRNFIQIISDIICSEIPNT
jgi:serine/threonine protein kinase